MSSESPALHCEIDLLPGQKLCLPQSLVDRVGPGHWLVTIQPADEASDPDSVRGHSAFLNGYSAADEGLYDEYASG